jgi:hypothetical protein
MWARSVIAEAIGVQLSSHGRFGGRGANIGTGPGRRNGAAAGPEKMVSRKTGRDVSRETFLRKRRGGSPKTRKMQNNPMHQKIWQ